MQAIRRLFGVSLVGFGLLLLGALLYDAGAVAELVAREPAPSEALVALVGLGLAAAALFAGTWILSRTLRVAADPRSH